MQACPTGALADAPLAQSEMIHSFKGTRPKEPFVIACATAREAEPGTARLSVACMGGVGWEMVLVPLLLGASRVELRHGDCTGCPAEAEAAAAMDRAREALRPARVELGLGDVEARELPADARPAREAEQARRRLSRRGLFSMFGSQARATAAQIGAALVDELEQPAELDALWLRTLVARLMRRRSELARSRVVSGLAARPEISDGRCTRCGLCATACPSGALARPARAARSRAMAHLVTLPHRCLGCERCVSACPERAVRLDTSIDLRAWSALRPAPLVLERTEGCRLCGGAGVLPGLDLCGPCRRARLLSSP